MPEIIPKIKSPECIIDMVMQYFYDGGVPITTQGIFDLLSANRDWLTLANLRCSMRDLQRKSPDTLERIGGCAKHGFLYEYTGVKYNPKSKIKATTIEKNEAQREIDAPLRRALVSLKW